MSIAVECASCERSIKVKDELASRKIKCPGCGKVLTVPDEEDIEEPQEEPDPQPAARRPRREEETEGKRSGGKRRAELEDGKTICRGKALSGLLFFLGFLGGALLLVVAGGIGLWAGITGRGKNVWESIGLVALGVTCLAAGGALCLWGGRGAWRHFIYSWKKERFIIGRDRLQWVLGEDELLGQIPYDNIEELGLIDLESPNGDPYQIIGLRFCNRQRRDTFINDDFRRSDWEEEDLDFAIWDLYDTPLKAFYKSLKKACEKAQNESG